MQFLWKYIDDLVGKGLEINQVMQLIFYASARFVPIALPIAMLLSSVMVFGKLGENSELVAMNSSGVSLAKIMRPFLAVSFIIALSSYLFSNHLMPLANLKNASMIYDIQKKKPALNIRPGVFYDDIEGFSIRIGNKKKDNREIEDILIYDHRNNNGGSKVITAKSGLMKTTDDERYLEISLFDGYSYIESKDKRREKINRRVHFKENLIRFDLSSFNIIKSSENLYKGHYAMLNNNQLNVAIDSLSKILEQKKEHFKESISSNYHYTYDNPITNINLNDLKEQVKVSDKKIDNVLINRLKTLRSITKNAKDDNEYRSVILAKHNIEWHRKITLAIACIILFFVGASFGAIIKKGGFGIPVLISVLLFVLYHVISIIGEKSVKKLSLDPWFGMWLSNFIFIPLAIFLSYKASKNSTLFKHL